MITDAHRKGLFCAIFMLALYSILLLPWQVEGKTATAVATETDGFAYENVKAYGAEGDGETDDTQAIRDAISSLPSGGGAVYIPEGRYLVTAPIHVGPGVNLKGEAAENGTGGSILKAGGDMSSIVTTGGWGHQMSIENLTLDGGAAQGYSVETAMALYGFCNSRAGNIKIHNINGTGIHLKGGGTIPAWVCWLDKIDIEITGEHFGIVAGSSDTYFNDVHVRGGKGIQDEAYCGNVYQNVVVEESLSSGFELANLSGSRAGVSITDSIFRNNAESGIKLSGKKANTVVVMGCSFEGNEYADVIINDSVRRVSLIENDFKSTGTESGENVIANGGADFISVSQNRFAGSSLELNGSGSSRNNNKFSVPDFSSSVAGLKPVIDAHLHQELYDIIGEEENQVVYDVRKRGAAGDGETDDTQAVQDVINDIPAGGTVYFPTGTYRITSPLQLKSNINIVGDGLRGSVSVIDGDNVDSVFKTVEPTSEVIITRLNISGRMDLNHLSDSVIDQVRGGRALLGPKSSNVIVRESNNSPELQGNNHILQSLYGTTVHIKGPGGGHRIYNSHIDKSSQPGAIMFSNPQGSSMDTVIRNCYFDLNDNHVVHIDFNEPQVANIDIEAVIFRSNEKEEIYINNPQNVSIKGAVCYHSSNLLKLEGKPQSVACVGNQFYGSYPPTFYLDVKANPRDGGTIVGGNDEYLQTTETKVSATAAAGYNFVNWTEDGEVVAETPEYTFSSTNDKYLIANFKSENVSSGESEQ